MWERAELKASAKEILKRNYWWVVVVTLIMGFVGGGGSSVNFGSYNSFQEGFESGYEAGQSLGYSDDYFDEYLDDYSDDYSDDYLDDYSDEEVFDIYGEDGNTSFDIGDTSGVAGLLAVGVAVFLFIFVIAMVVGVLLSTFVFSPIMIGCNRWYIKNRTANPQINEVVYVFGNGYMNVAKIMFFKALYTFLWSMLFIIPGIIKAYEYRMVPYLLAENPYMDKNEAFARSKNMMNGNKWDAFVLDWSFFGWELLSVFTCGLLSIFYVNPYIALTNTELYVKLCQLSGGSAPVDGGYSAQSGFDQEMFK